MMMMMMMIMTMMMMTMMMMITLPRRVLRCGKVCIIKPVPTRIGPDIVVFYTSATVTYSNDNVDDNDDDDYAVIMTMMQ